MIFKSRPLRSIGLLILTAVTFSASAQEAWYDRVVRPMQSDSPAIGTTNSAPHVNVNEFTGKVRVDLPPIGQGALSLAPIYLNHDLTPFPGTRPQPKSTSLGANWSMHKGYLVVRRVSRKGAEKVLYIGPDGGRTDFRVDNLFQEEGAPTYQSGAMANLCHTEHPAYDCQPDECPIWNPRCCEDWDQPEECFGYRGFRDRHWVDDSLRRISRSGGQSDFGSDSYVMLNPNGSKTYFELHAMRGTPEFSAAIYRPHTIIAPDGRKVTITYHEDDNDTPRIDHMTDEWGRKLRIDYSTINGQELPTAAFMNWEGQDRPLVTLEYHQTGEYASQPILSAYVTPMQRRYEINYEQGVYKHNFASLKLPTQGVVQVAYAMVPFKNLRTLDFSVQGEHPCPDPYDRNCLDSWSMQEQTYDRRMVASISHHDTTYHYSYQQFEPHTYDLRDPATGYQDDYARFDVTVTMSQGPVNYRILNPREVYTRKTRFYAAPFTFIDRPAFPSLLSGRVGQSEWRELSYQIHTKSGFDIASGTPETFQSDLFETWTYEKGDQLGVIHNPEMIPHRSDRVSSYSVTKDGQTYVRNFEYRPLTIAQTGKTIHTAVQAVISKISGNNKIFTRQEFTYSDRVQAVSGVDDSVYHSSALRIYQLDRPETQMEIRVENGESWITQRIEYDWLNTAQAINGEIPPGQLQEKRVQRGPGGDFLAKKFHYYGLSNNHPAAMPGRPAGALAVDEIEGLQTTFDNYLFDIAQIITPPIASMKTESQINSMGEVRLQTANGRTFDTRYDTDGRVRFEYDNSGADAAIEYRYGAQWYARISEGQWQQTVTDTWGRDTWERKRIENSTVQGDIKSNTWHQYNAIGLKEATRSHVDAVTMTEFDIHGRALRTRSLFAPRHGEDPPEGWTNSSIQMQYSTYANGRKVHKEIRNLENDSEYEVIHTEKDFFGRLIKSWKQLTSNPATADGAAQTVIHRYENLTVSGSAPHEYLEIIHIEPAGGTPRWRVHDWLGNMLREFHPEQMTGNTIPSPATSSGGDGVTHYRYDHLNRLTEEIGPNGVYHYVLTYDVADRLLSKEDLVSGERENFSYDDTKNFMDQSNREAVTTLYSEPDAANRPTKVSLTVPQPTAAPFNPQPSGETAATGQLLFQWQAASGAEEATLELRRVDGPSIVFTGLTPDAPFELDAATLENRVNQLNQLGVITNAAADAWRADLQNGLILAPGNTYAWRVQTYSSANGPSFFSPWIDLNVEGSALELVVHDLDFGAASEPVQQYLTIDHPELEELHSLDVIVEGDAFRSVYPVANLQGQGPTTLPVIYFPTNEAGDQGTLTLRSGGDNPQEWSGALSGSFAANYSLSLNDLDFGDVEQPVTLDYQITYAGFSSSPQTVNLNLSGPFSANISSFQAQTQGTQTIAITYNPQSLSGDTGVITATLAHDTSFSWTANLAGSLYDPSCNGIMTATQPNPVDDMGVVAIGEEKEWNLARLINDFEASQDQGLNTCINISHEYQVNYHSGPGMVQGGLTVTNTAEIPPKMDRLDQAWFPNFSFKPLSAGAMRATVTFTTTEGNSASIELQAEGVQPGALVASLSNQTPPSPVTNYHFGTVNVGLQKTTHIYIHNTGGFDTSFGVGVTGPFGVFNTSVANLGQGQSVGLFIHAQPTAEGRQWGDLIINPDDPNVPQLIIRLSVDGGDGSTLDISPLGPFDMGEISLFSGAAVKPRVISNISGGVIEEVKLSFTGETRGATATPPSGLDYFNPDQVRHESVGIRFPNEIGPIDGMLCYEVYGFDGDLNPDNNPLLETICEQITGFVPHTLATVEPVTPNIHMNPDTGGAWNGQGQVRLLNRSSKYVTQIALRLLETPKDGTTVSFSPSATVLSTTNNVNRGYERLIPVYFRGTETGIYTVGVEVEVTHAKGDDFPAGTDVQTATLTFHANPEGSGNATLTFDKSGE